jgi:hypothetical protein
MSLKLWRAIAAPLPDSSASSNSTSGGLTRT